VLREVVHGRQDGPGPFGMRVVLCEAELAMRRDASRLEGEPRGHQYGHALANRYNSLGCWFSFWIFRSK
jgi:hypothetical protein